jgi:hypothetical protein
MISGISGHRDEVEFRSREDVELENVNGGRTCSLVMYNCAGKPVARYH